MLSLYFAYLKFGQIHAYFCVFAFTCVCALVWSNIIYSRLLWLRTLVLVGTAVGKDKVAWFKAAGIIAAAAGFLPPPSLVAAGAAAGAAAAEREARVGLGLVREAIGKPRCELD